MNIKFATLLLISMNCFSSEFEIREELTKQYDGAKIVLLDKIDDTVSQKIQSVYEVRPGVAKVVSLSKNSNERTEKEVHFEALKTTWIAKKRIKPGEVFSKDDFKMEELNLTEPQIREVRGLLLSPDFEIEKYEARVTVLEGQFPILSGLQKIPAVKRGDLVKILLKSGDLELSVPGVVQEPSLIGGTLKVLTSSTKREISGVLKEGKIVEVIL